MNMFFCKECGKVEKDYTGLVGFKYKSSAEKLLDIISNK